jgi:hypothetical protein
MEVVGPVVSFFLSSRLEEIEEAIADEATYGQGAIVGAS